MLKEVRWKILLAVFKIKRFFRGWFGTRELDYPGAHIRISTQTIREFETRARSVLKEPKTVAWFEMHARAGSTIYDVGANVGAYSLIAASRGADVVAFEPSHQNAFELHENALMNGLDDRITVIPVVLGAKNGIARFKITDATFGASRGFLSSGEGEGKAYPMLSLDVARDIFSLPAPDALKIDTDGAEVELLRGASKTLGESSLRSVLIETDDANAEEVRRRMTEAGFAVAEEVRMDRHTVNYVFNRI